MSQANVESDPLFQLLTDALRAGPESAEWREAVQRVRESDRNADEFTLLIRARERLAEGREYRAVRPGPTFTRRVMSRIDEEAAQTDKGIHWAIVIAMLSAVVMIGVIVAVVYVLVPSRTDTSLDAPFDTVVNSIDVASGANARERIALARVSSNEPFAVEMKVQGGRASSGTTFTLDVVAEPPDELSVKFDGQAVRLLLPGNVSAAEVKTTPEQVHNVHVAVNRTHVMMRLDGKVIWTGEHRLPNAANRQIVLVLPDSSSGEMPIRSIRVLKR